MCHITTIKGLLQMRCLAILSFIFPTITHAFTDSNALIDGPSPAPVTLKRPHAIVPPHAIDEGEVGEMNSWIKSWVQSVLPNDDNLDQAPNDGNLDQAPVVTYSFNPLAPSFVPEKRTKAPRVFTVLPNGYIQPFSYTTQVQATIFANEEDVYTSPDSTPTQQTMADGSTVFFENYVWNYGYGTYTYIGSTQMSHPDFMLCWSYFVHDGSPALSVCFPDGSYTAVRVGQTCHAMVGDTLKAIKLLSYMPWNGMGRISIQ